MKKSFRIGLFRWYAYILPTEIEEIVTKKTQSHDFFLTLS